MDPGLLPQLVEGAALVSRNRPFTPGTWAKTKINWTLAFAAGPFGTNQSPLQYG
jgi:hypothetical protein